MECYVFDDVMDFSEASYLVKTLNSEAQKKIISSVFRGGSLVHSRFESYNGSMTEEQLFSRVKAYHLHSKKDIDSLFSYSRKFANSPEVGKRVLLVRAFMKHKLYSEALQEIQSILKVASRLSILHFYEGKIYLLLNEDEKAVASLLQAIQLKNGFADYHFYLGKAYLKLDKCKGAISEFTSAVQLNAYYSDACFHLGLAHLRNAMIKEDFKLSCDVSTLAGECFQKAAQLYPNFKDQRFIEAEELLQADEVEQAYEKFSSLVIDQVNGFEQDFILDFYIRYLGAEESLSIHETEEHIARLEGLLKKFANYADLHHELGIAHLILSKCIASKAVASFRNAVKINPGYSESQRMLKHLLNSKNSII